MANAKPMPTPFNKSVAKTDAIVTTITMAPCVSVLNISITFFNFNSLKPKTHSIAAKDAVGIISNN